jgi:Haem-dependent oxidative N-demethylase, alpha subunit-like
VTALDADVARYAQDPEPYLSMCRDGPPDWLDELELRPAPPHHRMGTRALDLADWFAVDGLRRSELLLRQRLLDERPADVFAVLPSAEDACAEALELVAAWTAERRLVPEVEPDADAHPLAIAATLVQEDLCLMVRRDGRWHLDAAVLCFPSAWVLGEKVGHTVADVHAPVDHYASDLEGRVDVFFDRFRVDRPVWRRNLSLKTTPALYLPYSKSEPLAAPAAVLDDGSPYWLRSERQTLRKLPRTGAILFGIRVQLAPASVLLQRPDTAGELLAMIESWDPPMRAFKAAGTMRELAMWLRRVAGSAPSPAPRRATGAAAGRPPAGSR